MKLSQFINESNHPSRKQVNEAIKAGVYDMKAVEDAKNGKNNGIDEMYGIELFRLYFHDIKEVADYSEGAWSEDEFETNFEGLFEELFVDPEEVQASVGYFDPYLDDTDEEYNQLIVTAFGDEFKADLTDKRGLQKVFNDACDAILNVVLERFGDDIELKKKVKPIQVK